MNKSIINQKNENYVEVADEPLHVELFQNRYIRLYNASLRAGAGTMFHRHCEDTIYIVHEGGEISTEIFPGSKKSPTSFPRSFGLHKKIRMGVRLIATGSIKLPRKLFFCILSKDQSIVHRAIASDKNSHNMELMGVEIVEKSNHKNEIILNGKNYKKEYENDNFSVFRFKLKPGESKNQVFNFPGLMIATDGKVEFKDFNSSLVNHGELNSGAFCWHDLDITRTFINKGKDVFEALIVGIK